ncbi:translesion error-prone DNA polymerase V autoproteolytic subunit [Roseateles saccharophilus]
MVDDSGNAVQQPAPEWAYWHACERCTGSRHLFNACSRSLSTSCHYCREPVEIAAPLGAMASVAAARLEALIDQDETSSSGLPLKMVGDVIRDNLKDANPTLCDDLIQIVGTAQSRSDLRPTQSYRWNYRRVGQEEQDKVWEGFRTSLRGRSRFFNADAKIFLDGLFSILPSLSPNGFFYANVQVDLDAGRTLFRARRANTQADIDRIKSSPARELHAPPPEITPSDRMNVERAPAFYAAFDNKTAIAEVRPSRGSRVVVGGFTTTRKLKIFDFTSLAKNSAPYFSIWSEDFVDRSRIGAKRIDLTAQLVQHPQATCLVRARGDSMRDAGIFDGDVLVVDKAVTAKNGHVVVAVIDGEFVCKQLQLRAGRMKLKAANPSYPDIVPKDGQVVEVWGVVTASIKTMPV